jgi:hypothetical protein
LKYAENVWNTIEELVASPDKERKTMMSERYVWYASYGSNLSKDRFLCYIKGGRAQGSSEVEEGCRNAADPLQDRPVQIPHPLYFSKTAAKWDHGGVAFLDAERRDSRTLGRMYLITQEQFVDVVKQENSLDKLPSIDFDSVIQHPQGVVLLKDKWYGRILYVGEEEGFPIFTFTSPEPFQASHATRPAESYLRMLILGYKETYEMNPEQIADYLISKPGVFEHYSFDELIQLTRDIC